MGEGNKRRTRLAADPVLDGRVALDAVVHADGAALSAVDGGNEDLLVPGIVLRQLEVVRLQVLAVPAPRGEEHRDRVDILLQSLRRPRLFGQLPSQPPGPSTQAAREQRPQHPPPPLCGREERGRRSFLCKGM